MTTYRSLISIPRDVTLLKHQGSLCIQGPLGSLSINLHDIDPFAWSSLSLDSHQGTLHIESLTKSYHGLVHSIFRNAFHGVTQGFLVYLKLLGIGYRVSIDQDTLVFKLGYAHDILYKIPQGVKIFVSDPTLFCVFGIDKNQVTQIARTLRDLRKPSVYKGKGIRFLHEYIPLKSGKRK